MYFGIKELGIDSLSDMLHTCHEMPESKGLIIFHNNQRLSVFVDEIMKQYADEGIEGIEKIEHDMSRNTGRIFFSNGSEIRVSSGEENIHGMKLPSYSIE